MNDEPIEYREYRSDAEWRRAGEERYGAFCRACGSSKHVEADHMKPRSQGGKNHVENLLFLCGAWGVQVAHRNEGKGIGMKTDDCATAAICVTCHSEIDNGKGLSRDERRQLMDRAIVLTVIQIARRGLVVPA